MVAKNKKIVKKKTVKRKVAKKKLEKKNDMFDDMRIALSKLKTAKEKEKQEKMEDMNLDEMILVANIMINILNRYTISTHEEYAVIGILDSNCKHRNFHVIDQHRNQASIKDILEAIGQRR